MIENVKWTAWTEWTEWTEWTLRELLEAGGGVLGALQRHADPGTVSVLLSHLHADHCLDLPGLFVWRRYHPSPPKGRALMYGPEATWARLGAASSPEGREIDDFTDIFDVHQWVDGESVRIGALDVLPRLVCHPTESYGMRFTDPSGATFVYSGDTGPCPALVEHVVERAISRIEKRSFQFFAKHRREQSFNATIGQYFERNPVAREYAIDGRAEVLLPGFLVEGQMVMTEEVVILPGGWLCH